MFVGVAGAADSAGPGRGQGVASHSHRPAAAADCQVRCWRWTRPAHTAGNRGFIASNVFSIFNPCIYRSSHMRCSPSKELQVKLSKRESFPCLASPQGRVNRPFRCQYGSSLLHLSYTWHSAMNTSESCPHHLISGCGGSPRLCPR